MLKRCGLLSVIHYQHYYSSIKMTRVVSDNYSSASLLCRASLLHDTSSKINQTYDLASKFVSVCIRYDLVCPLGLDFVFLGIIILASISFIRIHESIKIHRTIA